MQPPIAELQFHAMRLGSRAKSADLYGVSNKTMCLWLPTNDQIKYMAGQMVMVGGILAKKCLKCGTARELQHFWANPSAKSGCRETCNFCRMKEKEAAYISN